MNEEYEINEEEIDLTENIIAILELVDTVD
jgi:hypothetical protein